MKLWMDDIRTPPEGFQLWAKDYDDAITLLRTKRVTFVSFDHDLGEGKTGYDVAKWIEQQAALRFLPKLEWTVHSANPVGRDNIIAAMKSAERYW